MKRKAFNQYGPNLKSVFEMIDQESQELGKKHYACAWQGRPEGLFHICAEQNKEWLVELGRLPPRGRDQKYDEQQNAKPAES